MQCFHLGSDFAQKPFQVFLAECPRNSSQSFAWLGYDCLGGFLFSLGSAIRLFADNITVFSNGLRGKCGQYEFALVFIRTGGERERGQI